MNRKKPAAKFIAGLIVMLIAMIPEMTHLALFIDAVGLQFFLALIEVQVFAILATILGSAFIPLRSLSRQAMPCQLFGNNIKALSSAGRYLLMITSGPVLLMHLLVVSAVTGAVVNLS